MSTSASRLTTWFLLVALLLSSCNKSNPSDAYPTYDPFAPVNGTVVAVNAALADTPENVVKKLKALRKEKQDEADGRRTAEANMATLRKEKQQTDEQLTKANEKNAKLVTAYTETHTLASKLHEQLKPLVKDEKELPTMPELDKSLTEEAKDEPKGKNGKK